jgi:excisionase family DNA binding protein
MKMPILLALLLAASVDASANRANRRRRPDLDEPPMRRSVDLRTLSKMFGIPYSTLRQWIRDGRLKAYKVANARIRVYVDEFESLFTPVEPD